MILWSVKKETDIRRGRHCVFLMHVHLVFVTRYRCQIFDYDATEKLRTYFSNVCADFETELVEMDGEPDHVHLLINYPPKLAISSLVNSLKGVSSRLLRRDRPDIAVRYYYKGVLWSPGYFASSCGGAPISAIRQYIEQQQTPGQVENRAVYPRPEGRGFTAHRINQAKRMLVDQIISAKRSNINIHLQWVDIWLKNIVFLPFIQ
ncbi:TPA: IS200/IS605 family transposase [Escherichia coli]|nr:IS200/IS605 family transposase [Escherichia coli]HAM4204982.1 IS200/IS605 family transposase [Escherichia coli]HAM4238287.1 IS200/IS605 family transposase [Escherichia coli]HDB9947495.1 IS200/IS605 family transposase [Escherichia coli]